MSKKNSNSYVKYSAIGLVVVGGLFLAQQFSKLSRLAKRIVIEPSLKPKFNGLSGVTLQVDVNIKNPTNGAIKIKQPFVKIVDNINSDSPISTSNIRDKVITIQPNNQDNRLEPIYLTFDLLTLGSLATSLLNKFKTEGQLRLYAVISTSAVIAGQEFPIPDKIEAFSITNPVGEGGVLSTFTNLFKPKNG